jgi:DNA helicase-2/ATP-dependent DNA helicase PcrA
MSFARRMMGKPGKKNKREDKSADINNPGEEVEKTDSRGSFLESIGELAESAKQKNLPGGSVEENSLDEISIEDYPEAEASELTEKKIEELNSIIRKIEKTESGSQEIKLKGNYKIKYTRELNKSQLEAVVNIDGPVLVIAGAGSGKTRVIVHRVAFMLENGVFPNNILLLTFTRKAAGEMLGRVEELLKDKSAERVFGGTFHSFSNYILRKYANLLNISSNFNIIDSEDSADTIDLIKSELKFVKKEKAFPKKKRIYSIISSARNRNLTIREVIEREFSGLIEYTEALEMISQGYEKYKKICNLFDYDDLMEVLRDSLRENPVFRNKIQKEYNYIMVDEYQDTNVVQKEIVEMMAESHRNVLVVGDDAQSIYSFRGANYENILRFPQKYPECRVIKIEENYRSNQKILDFTNEIIRNSRIGYKKKLYSRIKKNTIPVVRKFYDQQMEADFIVTRIMEYREKGIPLNQVTVLVRAFWHARYIEVELNRRSIPYIAVGGLAFSERKHVKDIISYLRIIQNPYDAVAWHRILKYIPGVGLVTARKIIQKINSEGELSMNSFEKYKFAGGLRDLINMLNKAGKPEIPISHKIEIIKEYYAPILQSMELDAGIRLLDIDVLIDLGGNFESLDKFLTDFALDPPSRRFGNRSTPLIDESEDKPLTVSTIHSAKGLEWYGVFIPHALDGLLPSVRALKNLEELEEERRLFYVACSRAKEELMITMPSFVSTYNGFLSYPSRFIIEMNKEMFHYE